MLPTSSWVRDTLETQTKLRIKSEEIRLSIYAEGHDADSSSKGVQRIDMSLLTYNPNCKSDKIFWDAAVDLYRICVKFIPKDEAHHFVEQCWRIHLCKTWSTICKNRLDKLIRLGKRAPVFSDVIILSLLYGNDRVRHRPWYSQWTAVYNDDWKMPQMLEGLWLEENLPGDHGLMGLKQKVTTLEKGRETGKAGKARLESTDDEEPWMTIPASKASTPPVKAKTSLRRQSAVNSENRTRQLYDIYPTDGQVNEKKNVIAIHSMPPSIQLKRTARLQDDSDGHRDDKPKKSQKTKDQSKAFEEAAIHSKKKYSSVVPQSEQLGRSQTISLPGIQESSTEARDESVVVFTQSTQDTEADTERPEASEGTEAYLKQYKDDLAERQNAIAHFEALQSEKFAKLAERKSLEEKLKVIEKELETAYEKLKAVWDRSLN